MGKILNARKLSSMWGILILKPSMELVRKIEMNVVVAKMIYPLCVNHTL
jgi:hypothetical protein